MNLKLFFLPIVVAAYAAFADIPPYLDSHSHETTKGIITGQTQTPYIYQVGTAHICCGYGFIQPDGNVDWGDPLGKNRV